MRYEPKNPDWIERLYNYQNQLAENPKQTETSEDGTYLLVPIGILEDDLNFVYDGAIEIVIREQKEMFDHVSMRINLSIFHPVYEHWFTYSGTGAVPINATQKGEYKGSEKILVAESLKTAIAACYSECVKNAAKKIPGKRFGSDLNRVRKPKGEKVDKAELKNKAVTERLLDFIANAENLGQLNEILSQIGDNEEVRMAFNERLISLKPIYNGELAKKEKRTYKTRKK